MGFRVLLLAIREKSPESIHREYKVKATGRFEEIPESPVCGAVLPNGDYLLYINDRIVPENKILAKLSRQASLLACYANETTMDSMASAWVNSKEQWSVSHDAQQGLMNLTTTGNPPRELLPIQQRLTAEQQEDEGADFIFDIPIELFVQLGGHRYDCDIEGAGPTPWQVLKKTMF